MLVKTNSFNSIFDDFFTSPFLSDSSSSLMKTDVVDSGSEYNLSIELAGFKKDEISINFEEGYLTISANKNVETDSDSKDYKYIKRERVTKSLKRTFYIEDIDQEKITAKMSDGVLYLTLPKIQEKEPIKKTILID